MSAPESSRAHGGATDGRETIRGVTPEEVSPEMQMKILAFIIQPLRQDQNKRRRAISLLHDAMLKEGAR